MATLVFKKRPTGNRLFLYVLIREHRYFPPDDTKMVGATPEGIYENSERAMAFARIEAQRLHKMQREDVVIKDHCERKSTGNQEVLEYRVWYECKEDDKQTDRFCWVVRRVEVF